MRYPAVVSSFFFPLFDSFSFFYERRWLTPPDFPPRAIYVLLWRFSIAFTPLAVCLILFAARFTRALTLIVVYAHAPRVCLMLRYCLHYAILSPLTMRRAAMFACFLYIFFVTLRRLIFTAPLADMLMPDAIVAFWCLSRFAFWCEPFIRRWPDVLLLMPRHAWCECRYADIRAKMRYMAPDAARMPQRFRGYFAIDARAEAWRARCARSAACDWLYALSLPATAIVACWCAMRTAFMLFCLSLVYHCCFEVISYHLPSLMRFTRRLILSPRAYVACCCSICLWSAGAVQQRVTLYAWYGALCYAWGICWPPCRARKDSMSVCLFKDAAVWYKESRLRRRCLLFLIW